MFSHVHRLPSALSDSLPEAVATGDQIKHTVTLNEILWVSTLEIFGIRSISFWYIALQKCYIFEISI